MKTIIKILKEHFESVDSTNNKAALQSTQIKDRTLLLTTADEQTSGRGRFGHQWLSPSKLNFYGSFSFLFDSTRKDIGNLPQVLAISAAKALHNLGVAIELKWPNDLIIKGKKLGGILTEAKVNEHPNHIYMIIGIGININMPEEMLNNLGRPATSLMIELREINDIQKIRDILLQVFIQDLNLFIKCGFTSFLDEYKEKLCHKSGDQIRFHVHGEVLEGVFNEISESGSLKLFLQDGTISEFTSGEIF
ncbi:MAG: biotin--[acetyl-CoA-carboxylase] ligase [Parachlamydiaceae bacterium]|nr:biotin--[acetyl-CoA-carboxylase] ligase [Parachlamydiaceae bacterium]